LNIASQNLTLSKAYDGNTTAAIADLTLDGIVDGDVVTVSAVATYGDELVGTGKTITVVYTLAGADATNYTKPADFVSNAGIITAKQLTIADPALTLSKTYDGNTAATVTAGTLSGVEDGDGVTVSAVATYGDELVGTGKTITVVYTLAGADAANYIKPADFVSTAGVITAKQLTVNANANQSKVFGDADPVLIFSTSGFVDGENQNILTGVLKRAIGEDVGNYAIGQGTLSAGANYTINFTGADFTITPKTLTVKADANLTKVYGATDPVFTFLATGFENGDTNSILTGALARAEGENVGTYAINIGNLSAGANYSIDFTGANFTISAAALTITANNKTKTYGAALPELTVNYEGLVNGDTAPATLPTIATTATASSGVGTYPITVQGAADSNYSISYFNGTLTVIPAILTITADNKERLYKESNPLFTFTLTGLVNGDNTIAIEPTLSTVANINSPVGTYVVGISGASDPNYTINQVPGELNILPRPTNITWEDFEAPIDAGSIQFVPVVTDNTSPVNYTIADESIAKLVNGILILQKTGETTITATQASDGNHLAASIVVKITVLPASEDSDGDGVPDFVEIQQGTDPADPLNYKDSDGDGVPDFVEIQQGTNPNNKDSFLDSNKDGVPDYIRVRSILTAVELPLISVSWNTPLENLGIPAQVLVLNGKSEFVNLEVVWDLDKYDPIVSGKTTFIGLLQLPRGVFNPYNISATQEVEVRKKPAPEDVLISSETFQADVQFFYNVGSFKVVDPSDNIHLIELVEGFGDNGFFEVKQGFLFWSSSDRAAGKVQFQIKIRVTDRTGNIIEKVFTLTRLRTNLEQIQISNSFTPDGDGINDTWGVEDLTYYDGVRIQIFDRSGARLFVTTDPRIRWDGTYNGKELATGTYYYAIEIKENNQIRRGFINLFK
jgi:gliding motility-associated-like protein